MNANKIINFIYTTSIMLPVDEEVLNSIGVHTMVQKNKTKQNTPTY